MSILRPISTQYHRAQVLFVQTIELAKDLQNVSKACKVMGYSRQQFYEIRRNYQTFGSEGLIDKLPGPRGPHPNRVSEEIEAAILEHSHAQGGRQGLSAVCHRLLQPLCLGPPVTPINCLSRQSTCSTTTCCPSSRLTTPRSARCSATTAGNSVGARTSTRMNCSFSSKRSSIAPPRFGGHKAMGSSSGFTAHCWMSTSAFRGAPSGTRLWKRCRRT